MVGELSLVESLLGPLFGEMVEVFEVLDELLFSPGAIGEQVELPSGDVVGGSELEVMLFWREELGPPIMHVAFIVGLELNGGNDPIEV